MVRKGLDRKYVEIEKLFRAAYRGTKEFEDSQN